MAKLMTESTALPTAPHVASTREEAGGTRAEPNEIRDLMNESFGETLRPLLIALSCMYAVFVVIDLFSLSSNAAYESIVLLDLGMLALAVAGAAVCGPSGAWHGYSHAIATVFVGLMLVNHTISVYQIRDPQYANDLGILMIGSGCLFLSTFWLSLVACMVLATWGLMLLYVPDIAISPYMFASSTAVALFAHGARVRTMRRLHRLRLGDKRQKEQVQRSLESARAEIEARRRAEEEKMQLEAELLQSQKLEAIGTLAGGVAHDFNNLLTGILGYSNMLKSEFSPEDPAWEAADIIEKAAERGSLLTKQLLGFARKGRQQVIELDLRDSAREVVQFLSRTLNKNIEIEESYHEGPATVRGDPTQIYQVILNLAVNARDAMQHGGRLRVETRCVEVSGPELLGPEVESRAGRFVRLTVGDNGPGIPQEIQNRIFEPFFTTKDRDKGTGMGLATAYGIVRNHDGRIQLSSGPGEGAVFTIDLPQVEATIVTQETGTSQRTGATASGRILVVDDEEMVRRLAQTMLIRLGYDVVTASSGAEAVEVFRKADKPFDLVLLDMIMPGMDGRECFLALKSIDPKVRAVISSGFSQEGAAQESIDKGVRGFVQKPYRLSELSEVISAALAD